MYRLTLLEFSQQRCGEQWTCHKPVLALVPRVFIILLIGGRYCFIRKNPFPPKKLRLMRTKICPIALYLVFLIPRHAALRRIYVTCWTRSRRTRTCTHSYSPTTVVIVVVANEKCTLPFKSLLYFFPHPTRNAFLYSQLDRGDILSRLYFLLYIYKTVLN